MTDNIPDPAIYRGAADVIRENGWHQGDMYAVGANAKPAKCPVAVDGAIRIVVCGQPDAVDEVACLAATDWFDDFMNATVPGFFDDFGDYVGWNDADERTEAEVLDALERAAVAAESARAEAAQDGGAA